MEHKLVKLQINKLLEQY